jgi:hypothetical protein
MTTIRFTTIRPTAAAAARTMRDANQAAVSHSYFVVMIDLGRLGLEAIVQPEITRREVVSRLVSGEYRDVVFIHEIADGAVTDVTLELQVEASMQQEAA